MHTVIVVGGGASGMMAACIASANGKKVILIEKNEKLGKKVYITGKGRCNLTNNVENNEFFQNIVTNSKFMFSSINTFSPSSTMDFFESKGLRLKTERGNRVFPLSDKASDVTKTLEKELINQGVDIRLNTEVKSLIVNENKVVGVEFSNGKEYCDSVIICTGGVSYPLTGSTGDGYKFAKRVGHSITELRPSLVGVELLGSDFIDLQGLSLKNVSLSAKIDQKTVYSDFGECLFTHFGISGPIVLSCSAIINKMILSLDLKPALDFDTLDKRLINEFSVNNNKELSTAMRGLLPKSLISVVLSKAQVKQSKNCSEITQVERFNIINTLKNLTFKVKKLRSIGEAIVTSGGVNVKEINPKTMESKLVKGLYFSGEVLDVDAFTGGFNLQIAFSTGYVAGLNA